MAKGATASRKAARKIEKRDGRVRESLDASVAGVLADWALVVCDGCGLELSYQPGICCVVCGGATGTYAPADRANLALASLRKFSASL